MYRQGQRWFSEAEPELGLGVLSQVENKTIKIDFPAANESRTYGIKTAPLKRVLFEIGETIQLETGETLIVEKCQNNDGVYFYLSNEQVIPEMLLKSSLSFTKPQDKLFAGNFDAQELYQLRYLSYLLQRSYQLFPYKGLLGSRVRLIPHQAYITSTIADRLNPRVMLADEVGLGKTIEAGLVLKSLIQKNRIQRSLVLVPDSLVYQWYFELLNKFNIQCQVMSMVDELEIEAQNLDEGQHYIISLKRIMDDPRLEQKILDETWDMLIVDEAHQLRWSPQEQSSEYNLVSRLSQQVKSLILLSATPEILGKEGHFSRLKLLDKDKFSFYEKFEQSSDEYAQYIPVIKKIISNEYNQDDLKNYFSEEEIQNFQDHSEIVQALIDRHGTGRVYFRNTREYLEKFNLFFPKRKLNDYPIVIKDRLSDSIVFKNKFDRLLSLITSVKDEKILLLVHSKILVQKLAQSLKKETTIPIALFHSGQSLMERDRQAAYFAEKDGAKILLCTEIGSEGRNFEFAHHLFLFDLPKIPEQLEQRIGRLDRIGQSKDINIHVPYVKDSFEEILFLWYRDVIKSFLQAPKGATPFYRKHYQQLHELLESPFDRVKLDNFIKEKSADYEHLCDELGKGHDLLLDLNSFNQEKSIEVIHTVNNYPDNLKNYLDLICNAVGISQDDLNEFSTFIRPSDNMFLPSYPALPIDGYSYTLERDVALVREDLQYMSWEHPLVQGSLDLFTNSEIGNMTVVTHDNKMGENIFFEFIFKLEIIHGQKSDSSQYLPITPLRVLMDTKGQDLTQKFAKSKLDPLVKDIHSLEDKEKVKQIPKDFFKQLLSKAQAIATKRAQKYIQEALKNCEHHCQKEIFRLEQLKKINAMIDELEIENWRQHMQAQMDQIKNADVSIDAIRLIL